MTGMMPSQTPADAQRSSLIPAPLHIRSRPMTTSRIPAYPPATRRLRNARDLYAISARAQVALQEINQALAEMQAFEDPFSQHDPITPIQLGLWEQQAQARRALRRRRAMPDIAAELRQALPEETAERADKVVEIGEKPLDEELDLGTQTASVTEENGSVDLLTALKLTPPEYPGDRQLAAKPHPPKPQNITDFTTFTAPKSISQRRLHAKKHVPPSLCIASESSLAVMPLPEPESVEATRIDSPQLDPLDDTRSDSPMLINVAAELEVLEHDRRAEREIAAAQPNYPHRPSRVSKLMDDLKHEPGNIHRTTPVIIDVEAELKLLSQDQVGEAMVDLAKLQRASVNKTSGGRTKGQYTLSPLDLGTPWGGFCF